MIPAPEPVPKAKKCGKKQKRLAVRTFTSVRWRVYWKHKFLQVCSFGITPMGSFGEDLRMERTSRGIALEHITAVTKISQHHLVALEQEKFRQLPGGILSKGIIRGYANAIGLDQQDWTERFLKAYTASGLVMEDPNWTAFASNVG